MLILQNFPSLRQAVEHLLIALKQQVSGRGIHGEKSYAMSESIWTTLKLALSLSERKDLLPLAEKRLVICTPVMLECILLAHKVLQMVKSNLEFFL